MKPKATATWNGDLQSGNGTMSGESGAFSDLAFSFQTRFEDAPGTNPEELVGAAQAGCFSMAFSNELAKADLNPTSVSTKASVVLGAVEGGHAITRIDLVAIADVPGGDEAQIRQIADAAKQGCPISRSLSADITLDLTIKT
ncbi:OsmC family protein [Tropicimonas sp. TH_r6]|uniref:OsmC family protein n=1 Tax=Tropicimonas sp. TH_r6 TaxID=3082085 RepID=UPI002952F2EA|nr:OsmC family protein [Tropicimonas sp. TH_r6]MDV7144449.1 OsmC family protein [Tropicimonas sp. TH_r6]